MAIAQCLEQEYADHLTAMRQAPVLMPDRLIQKVLLATHKPAAFQIKEVRATAIPVDSVEEQFNVMAHVQEGLQACLQVTEPTATAELAAVEG